MKCISKKTKGNRIAVCIAIISILLTGCSGEKYDFAYDPELEVTSFNVLTTQEVNTADPFAYDLCVVDTDVISDKDLDMSQITSAVLFDVNKKDVVFSKNAHEQLHPASLTKVMTALVALQNGSLDQVLTATDSVLIDESGAQLLGLKNGDSMTLDQALHALLMYSANDVAVLIAENIGGSVDNFVAMMNEEAHRIGATNTHFLNPHGLTEDGHYTTAYDLYLIFNEAIKYETFNEIIHMTNYQMTYYDNEGNAKEKTLETTNLFLKGNYEVPGNINVIGGKTGTTNAAKSCLILLSRDASGQPYISVILKAETRDILYNGMAGLLDEINK